jgi:hypothetical protein
MDQESLFNQKQFLELFLACEEIEKIEVALKTLSPWLTNDVIEDVQKKIVKFKKENKVFITKKFRLSEAHRDLLPFMRSAQNRALEKIREMGIVKDEDNAFRRP